MLTIAFYVQVDLQPYLDIVTDELEWLYYEGVDVPDPSTGSDATFCCKAMLMSVVSDYRGFPKLFRLSQSPALNGGCYIYEQKGIKLGLKKKQTTGVAASSDDGNDR